MIVLHSYGLHVMVIAFIIINVGWLLVWHYFAWKLVSLSLWDILKDVIPFILFSLFAILLSWFTTRNITHPLWLMLAKIVTTAVYYPAILWICRAQVLRESIQFLKKKKS